MIDLTGDEATATRLQALVMPSERVLVMGSHDNVECVVTDANVYVVTSESTRVSALANVQSVEAMNSVGDRPNPRHWVRIRYGALLQQDIPVRDAEARDAVWGAVREGMTRDR